MPDSVKMIDVSVHQGNINWAEVKEKGKINDVIMRVGISLRTNGVFTTNKDTKFEYNYENAKKNGFNVGVYYYSKALSESEAIQEARFVMSVISGKKFEYPIYIDIEEKALFALGKDKTSKIVKAFLSEVEKNGYWVGLYGSRYPLVDYVSADIRSRYAVWVAHVDVKNTSYPDAYGIWQHSWTGRVSGISGAVDLDICYVDYPSKIKAKGLNGYAKSNEVPEQPKQVFNNPYQVPTRALRKGDSGDDVKWLQFSLTYLNYNCGNSGVDGSFGTNTDKAVRAFQSDNGLAVDGVCGPATKAALIRETGQSEQDVKRHTFIQRTERPEAGNKFYITRSAGGWSTAIVGRPTDNKCNVLSNCVGYAFGRFNEILYQLINSADIGKLFRENGGSLVDLKLNKEMPLLAPRNAENFYDIAIKQGLTTSKTPQEGAIMCWQKGATLDPGDGAGHVAVVERVISNTEVVTSESGYNCKNPFWTQTRKKGNGNWGQANTYTFLGFILNPAVK